MVQVGMLAVVCVAFAALNPSFLSIDGVFGVFQGFALLGLVTAGVGVTIIAGELDLSVGSMAAVGGVAAVSLLPLGTIPAVLITVIVCTAFGALQGALVAKLNINSLVFTIGTMFALRGVAYVLAGEEAVLVPLDQLNLSNGVISRMGIVSPFTIITLAIMALVGGYLAFTRYGREIYAVGGGRHESKAAGVRQIRPIASAFAISAGTAGLAGSLSSIASGSAAPFAFTSILLSAITAVLIGGLAVDGGRGSMANIMLGALILATLTAGMSSEGVPSAVQQLVIGALLLIIIAVEIAKGRKKFNLSASALVSADARRRSIRAADPLANRRRQEKM
ncbi:ribose/xylose/arabinose/galactoside ABC-type transport system permease subunit [Microbacterium sp. BE35]|uniref:ABC transporter permease n=1 Tax=Microbacterium sp. BE35 TaxID=2817773 RepID=UPI00285A3EC0|nr:ABC transporter permease [Microbacterium sp. BE35]MDR7188186.1 ribose/xylose/arabinose/galactoside ABC-type transport system permease subunit [Microbacterium sp. BE35]